jgi:hypothetical protein
MLQRTGLLVCLALLLGWPEVGRTQNCTPDTIILTSQAEVDDFQINHGPCDRIDSFLFIGPSSDITNLDGLSGLVDIFALSISGNSSLTDISGLSSMATAGAILIQNNPLSNLNGLSGPTNLVALQLLDNPFLSNLSAISGLTSLVNLVIGGNDVLANLDSLSGLTAVTGDINIINNPVLTDISGLTGASGFQSLDIRQNPLLTSLDGLQGETALTGLILEDNDSLTNVDPLAGLASVGNFHPEMLIIDNDSLANLDGLGSLISVDTDLTVNNNPMLGDCSAISTLVDGVDDGDPGPGPGAAGIPDINGNVTIAFNQANCNSIAEILDGPALDPFELIPGDVVIQGGILDIQGVASDVGHGNSNVVNVEYAVNAGPWTGTSPVDGSFDSPTEAFHALLNTSSLSIGMHGVCARAEDALGHLSQRCIPFEVVQGAVDAEWMVVCTHQPVWPQPGETIEVWLTVRERGEGDEGTPAFGVDRTEIWFEDPLEPVDVNDNVGTSSNIYESDTLVAGTVTYGCRATLGDEAIFSGWRTVAVGTPAGDGPIPIGYTGLKSQRLDVVFVADDDSYTGSSDPDFLADIRLAIRQSFFQYGYYNRYQHLFNFWISRNTGTASRSGPEGDAMKTIGKPFDWEEEYSFADTAALVHLDSFREFAKNGFFTLEPGEEASTTSHETGHSPFGLSDEYCCDSTYYERNVFPNVYESLAACEADAPDLGRTAEDCRTWDKLDGDGKIVSTWYSSEPTPNDLMNGDQTPPQAADKRRIDWFFEKCGDEEC